MTDANHYTLDMSITHADFFRLLPAAIVPYHADIKGNVIDISQDRRLLKITLGEETLWRLTGLLSFPRTQVEFLFTGFSDEQRTAFIHRFDRYFHRGGG